MNDDIFVFVRVPQRDCINPVGVKFYFPSPFGQKNTKSTPQIPDSDVSDFCRILPEENQ